MASELRVNTLKDASGNNSIATSFVASGSLKMWGRGSSDGGTLHDSFNVSSLGDTATGRQTYNFTSAMSDGLYSSHFSPSGSYCYSNAVEPTASALSTRARNNLDALFDTGVQVSAQGDLA